MIFSAEFYPSKTDGKKMLEYIENNYIRTSSSDELMVYLCKFHNVINKELGKEQVICEDVPVLWGRDECDCDDEEDEEVKDSPAKEDSLANP